MRTLIVILGTALGYIPAVIRIFYATLSACLVIWSFCEIISHIYNMTSITSLKEIPLAAVIIFLAEYYYSSYLWNKK